MGSWSTAWLATSPLVSPTLFLSTGQKEGGGGLREAGGIPRDQQASRSCVAHASQAANVLTCSLLLSSGPSIFSARLRLQERGDTVSGGWDPELQARRKVRLPELTAEQARRKEYFYPTAVEVGARAQELQERQRRLEAKQAKLNQVSLAASFFSVVAGARFQPTESC